MKHCKLCADSSCGGETRTEPEGRPTDRALRSQAAPLSRCTHRPTTHRRPHTLVLDIPLPTPPPSSASLPSLTSKRLRGFGAMGLRGGAHYSEPVRGCLIAPLAVEGCAGACMRVCPLLHSFPGPATSTPLPARGSFRNRPAAENSLAGGGCKRSAVERFN